MIVEAPGRRMVGSGEDRDFSQNLIMKFIFLKMQNWFMRNGVEVVGTEQCQKAYARADGKYDRFQCFAPEIRSTESTSAHLSFFNLRLFRPQVRRACVPGALDRCRSKSSLEV